MRILWRRLPTSLILLFVMEPRLTLLTLGVADLPRAVRFYRDGLGFPTTYTDGDPVAFLDTLGTKISLYPFADLAVDIAPDIPSIPSIPSTFRGFTLAHNVRTREEVARVLALAERAGARIVKPAQDTLWGGHAGYFLDLDGHAWEVAWNPGLPLDEQGFMKLP